MTMKALLSTLVLATALFAAPVYAACPYPKAPDKVPDGNTAALEEMLATQKTVKQFDTEIAAYQTCLETEHNAALQADAAKLNDEQKAERVKVLQQKQNAAAEESLAVANRFNEQVRVYREKNKKK